MNRILEKYTVYGVETVYQCSHGKRRNHLDEIGEELEMYFDENPPESVPDAVQKNKRTFWSCDYRNTGQNLVKKKRNIVTGSQKVYQEKQI